MFGIRLIAILALMGGIIAYIADKLGSKIGKKRLTIFGLRPHKTSVLLTVLSGMLIAACTIGVLAVASQSARTALFGMDKLQKEMTALTEVLKRHPHVALMTDDIYEHIRFDGGEPVCPVALAPELRERTLLVNGVSKT